MYAVFFTSLQKSIFTFAVEHIRKQGHRSYISYIKGLGNGCRYRKGNDKCAYGAFIPDNEYKPNMEGLGVSLVYIDLNYIAPAFRDELNRWASQLHRQLASQLQIAHDNNEDAEELNKSLKNIMYEYNFQEFEPIKVSKIERKVSAAKQCHNGLVFVLLGISASAANKIKRFWTIRCDFLNGVIPSIPIC